MDDLGRLADAADDPEGIREVLRIEVTAQLADGYRVVLHAGHLGDQRLLGAVGRADVVDLPPVVHQSRNQRQVRRDVTGSAAAGQDDLLHYKDSLQNFKLDLERNLSRLAL